MRPLMEAEWEVYTEAALEEWRHKRGVHEDALRAVGHSTFFNSRVSVARAFQLKAVCGARFRLKGVAHIFKLLG